MNLAGFFWSVLSGNEMNEEVTICVHNGHTLHSSNNVNTTAVSYQFILTI